MGTDITLDSAMNPSSHTAGEHSTMHRQPAASGGRPSMPGLRSAPVLGWRGNALSVLSDPALKMLRLHQKYGDIVAFGQEKKAPVAVFSPEYNHLLLTNTKLFYSLDVTDSASPIRIPRGTAAATLLSGVAGMNGEKHTYHRRLLMPGFHRQRVDMLRDTVVARTEEHIAHWKTGQQIDLVHEMVELSLSLAVSGLLGLDPGTEGNHVRHLLHDWGKHGLAPQVTMLPYDLPGLPYYRFQRLSEQLEAEFKRIIKVKRETGTDTGDALAILLHAQDEDGSALTETELLGHLTTFFTAGHETSASAMVWTLFLLSEHPEIMHDLMDELDAKLGGEAPTLDNMRDLPLLDGVINEGLRMFPPGMWMLRTATDDFDLGPYHLPKDTHVIFSPAVTHRRSDIYEEPHRFNPRRWETIKPNTYVYLPFGGGPRRCLGSTFAQMELKVVLPIILQRYRLTIPEGTRVDRGGSILSFPKGGLPTILSEQDRRFRRTNITGNIHDLVHFN